MPDSSRPGLDAAAAVAGPVHDELEVIDEAPELLGADDAVAAPVPPPMTPRRPAATAPTLSEITEQDRDFITRVFQQVRDVDFRAPPPPPPAKNLAGPDKKIASLRNKVHELERDLARVGYVWGAMQQQYEAVEQIIAAKEAEREAAVARHQQIKDLAAQAALRDRAELDSLRKRVADLEAACDVLDAEGKKVRADAEAALAQASARLAKSEQEKNALLADFRAKMEAAQHAFNSLRDQSTRAIAEYERRLKRREEELAAKSKEAEIGAERARELESARGALAQRDAQLAQLKEERQRQDATLADRDHTLSTLADEMAKMRAQHESLLKIKDELVESARHEVKSARAEFTQLAEQFEARKRDLAAAQAELESLRPKAGHIESELAARDAALAEAQSALSTARDEARVARADADAMAQKLAEAHK